MNITTQDVYTAALAGMFLVAGFLVVNLLIASGRVLRGKDSVSELPMRLLGITIAGALALTAWPYGRAAILNTIGQDADAAVQTLNGLGNLAGKAGSMTVGSDLGLDTSEYSDLQLGDVGAAIREFISAPEPETWTDEQGQETTNTTVEVFKPLTMNDEPVVGEMSANDPNLPPTFPDPTPTPAVNYRAAGITPQLQNTVERNSSWLGFMTDDDGLPLTADMSHYTPTQSENDATSTQSESSTGTGSSIFKPLNDGGGGPTDPPVKPAGTITVYTVQRGDTMFLIAKWWFKDGDRWPEICAANPMPDCSKLRVGQVLNLP